MTRAQQSSRPMTPMMRTTFDWQVTDFALPIRQLPGQWKFLISLGGRKTKHGQSPNCGDGETPPPKAPKPRAMQPTAMP